ncbi:hypothetical protein PVAP13_6KG032000 [Panicum virgatum]|uniref:Zinc finger LSD1-type domain-containing protein n=1 Tax=Panicum virgatum TaxID=38727 RepID=A0A8T0R6P1_PANVG|nr:hypothetical protein PVAP13_6KG032000 [Panicum virgatum]
MQDQLICSGCKRVLQYRRGATGVCCPSCSTFTAANPSGSEMSELVCGGCFTMLVYNRGAANIRCPHCGRVNSTRSAANQIGHLSCGHCRTTLAYPPGASTVGCPTCRCVNPVRNNNSGGSARPAPSVCSPGFSKFQWSLQFSSAIGQNLGGQYCLHQETYGAINDRNATFPFCCVNQ